MYPTVLAPAAPGFYSDLEGTINYSLSLTGCEYGKVAEDDHAKNNAPGKKSYEPFGESRFVTVRTLVHGHTSDVAQECTLTIRPSEKSSPYVVVAGTKEEVIEAMVAGLPIWVAFVSAWNSNHVYVYVLGILLIVAGVGAHYDRDSGRLLRCRDPARNRGRPRLPDGLGARDRPPLRDHTDRDRGLCHRLPRPLALAIIAVITLLSPTHRGSTSRSSRSRLTSPGGKTGWERWVSHRGSRGCTRRSWSSTLTLSEACGRIPSCSRIGGCAQH